MLQIDKQNFIPIGYIQKIYRLSGEVIAFIEDEFIDTIEKFEFLFIDLDGGLVPFYIIKDGLRYKDNEKIIVKFDFVDSPAKAKNLIGCKLFADKRDLPEKGNPVSSNGLIGMEVIDQNRGNIGKVDRIDDFGGNVVITVRNLKGELLIPLNEQIISEIDIENRVLYLECPDGLIDIYIE